MLASAFPLRTAANSAAASGRRAVATTRVLAVLRNPRTKPKPMPREAPVIKTVRILNRQEIHRNKLVKEVYKIRFLFILKMEESKDRGRGLGRAVFKSAKMPLQNFTPTRTGQNIK